MDPISNPNVISCETSRSLDDISYTGSSQNASIKIPTDSVYKRLALRFYGVITVTYGSGSPIANELGMSRLIDSIQIVADGNRTIKNLHPYMSRMHTLMTRGHVPERSNVTNTASTYLGQNESQNGPWFTYPSTTQNVILNESMEVCFENLLAYSENDRLATLFNAKGLSTVYLKANFLDASNLQRVESSPVSIAYSAGDFKLKTSTIEAQSIPADQQFFDLKESFSSETFTGQTNRREVKLNTGNLLCGIGILAKNGTANTLLSDVAVTSLELRVNGQRVIHETDFISSQQRLRARWGMVDAKSSAAHNMKGFTFINLLNMGKISSALNTSKAAGVDSVSLYISTGSASGNDPATYTNPVEVIYAPIEIAAPQLKA